jgi:RecA/RadA recombinase
MGTRLELFKEEPYLNIDRNHTTKHMSIKDKLIKNSKIAETAVLKTSKFFTEKDQIHVGIPALDIALSGDLDGGFEPGLTLWCGPSKHFKTLYSLLMVKVYLDKYKDAVCLFYDSEFGAPHAYWESVGIDMDRVIHCPLTDIEQFKFDIMSQLAEIKRGERVIIFVDSIGNLASKKEVEDALKESSAQDMTRAKQLKSCFRMITPHLTIKDIPMVCVNHIYMTQEMYSKPVVSGGTGIYLSADNIYIIGRQQEKEGDEIVGYNFVINVEKSRHCREKTKIKVLVTHEGGLSRWSGLMDMALESGHVVKPKNGWYAKVNQDTGEIDGKNYRLADTENAEFWGPILKDQKFKDWIKSNYQVAHNTLLQDSDIDSDAMDNFEYDELE